MYETLKKALPPEEFATDRIRSFVRKQLFWGGRYLAWEALREAVAD